jgi:hypothetical protein
MAIVFKVSGKKIFEKLYRVQCPYCFKMHVHDLTDREINSIVGVLPHIEENYVYRTVEGCGTYEIGEIDE